MSSTEGAASRQEAAGGLRTERIQALSDGVFAVAMTLLVLDIRVPLTHGHSVPAAELPRHLLELIPEVVTFVMSFVVLGVYWIGHHNQFHYIRRADRPFFWINLFFLVTIAFIPFSAALIAQYPTDRLTVVIYAANLIATGLMLFVHWVYAASDGRLTGAVPREVDRGARRRILLAPAGYALAIVLSLISTWLSVAIFIITPILYILPVTFDRHFMRR